MMSRRHVCIGLLSAGLASSAGLRAQVPRGGGETLFRNVRVFDGKSRHLSDPTDVLIRGNAIADIGRSSATGPRVIDGAGRTLMPGLIDAHWHSTFVSMRPAELLAADAGYTNLLAGAQATATLMRGFTTVRDMGGPSFSLKRAIDAGVLPGPRIYPSGAMITITSGHGDFRQLSDLPRSPGGPLTRMEILGGSAIADSADEVRLRAREQLMQGATQIKLTAGGGASSPFSPLDVSTFTEAELRAAVEAAENWGTYVAVHAYTSAAIQRAIEAGVKCIEHGHLMDDATARNMAERGIWLSTQPFLDDADSNPQPEGSPERAKQLQIAAGTDRVYALARKYRLKTAFGTDMLFSPQLAGRQGARLSKLTRWYRPSEALNQATAANGELLRLCGLRNPYPGTLGVVEEGALADLILVDGNPLENIELISDPDRNFLVIMKDGTIYKNLADQ